MATYIEQLFEHFKNVTLNAIGIERDFYELLNDKDVTRAIKLMRDRDTDVDIAISEYNPQLHKVMRRKNKVRKNKETYITEKLPRSRQRYINEVELFFLLGKPIKFTKASGDDKAYALFTDFLREQHFDSNMRKAKRFAGSETESAKLYDIYKDNKAEGGESIRVQCRVLSRENGYKLRPMFDHRGNLVAFAYGYRTQENDKKVRQHWIIQTADFIFECVEGKNFSWEVDRYANPTGKINIIYYEQKKAWDGVESRIEREEMLDSKAADTNNYFADPMAKASADVINSLADPHSVGKLIQLSGTNSTFEYINPPSSSATLEAEKRDLRDSILFDSFTPDFSYENLKGMGSLSGVAIENSMALAYIKRENLMETYGEMLEREISVVKGILKYLHPSMAEAIDGLVINFEYAMPFAQGEDADRAMLLNLFKGGLVSRETAVELLGMVKDSGEELGKLNEDTARSIEIATAQRQVASNQ